MLCSIWPRAIVLKPALASTAQRDPDFQSLHAIQSFVALTSSAGPRNPERTTARKESGRFRREESGIPFRNAVSTRRSRHTSGSAAGDARRVGSTASVASCEAL